MQLTPVPSRLGPRDGAVSDVISNILMVAITVLLIGSLALSIPLVLGDPGEALNADLRASNTGTSMRVAHVGGEHVDEGQMRISVTRDGSTTTEPLSAFAGCVTGGDGLSDGLWSVGETLDVTCRYAGQNTTISAVILVGYDAIQVDWSGAVILGTGSPGNTAPVADANGPYTLDEGSSKTLDGTNTTDDDGDPLTVSWTFVGDNQGATLTDEDTLTPTFTAPGNVDGDKIVTVKLTVDDGNITDTDRTTVTILDADGSGNAPPEADAGGPYSVNEEESILLDGTGSDDPDGDSLTFEWTITGDAHGGVLTDATTATPTFESTTNVDGDKSVTVRVNVSDGNGGTDSDQTTVTIVDADGSGGGVSHTYVDCPMSATTGTVSNCSNARSDSDGGASAVLTEESTSTSTTSKYDADTLVSSTSVTDPSNVLVSDDARADFTSTSSTLEVTGFDLPDDATGVTSVVIGFEARKDQGGGQNPTLELTYDVGGTAGSTGLSTTVSTTSDAAHTVNVTGDRSWTVADVEDISLTLEMTDQQNRVAEVDHVFVTVRTESGDEYNLLVEGSFSSVPDGTTHLLQIRYHIDSDADADTFDVEVWDGSTWNDRGDLTSTSFDTFEYTLTAGEWQSGFPQVRFVDKIPDDPDGAHSLTIDYLRVESS